MKRLWRRLTDFLENALVQSVQNAHDKKVTKLVNEHTTTERKLHAGTIPIRHN
jgi:hypothetical protein